MQSAGFDDGNMARIAINDKPIVMEPNETGHFRGLHLAIIDPKSGKPQHARVFDTYESSAGIDEFLNTTEIPDGHIVAAACKDDFEGQLSRKVKEFFA